MHLWMWFFLPLRYSISIWKKGRKMLERIQYKELQIINMNINIIIIIIEKYEIVYIYIHILLLYCRNVFKRKFSIRKNSSHMCMNNRAINMNFSTWKAKCCRRLLEKADKLLTNMCYLHMNMYIWNLEGDLKHPAMHTQIHTPTLCNLSSVHPLLQFRWQNETLFFEDNIFTAIKIKYTYIFIIIIIIIHLYIIQI